MPKRMPSSKVHSVAEYLMRLCKKYDVCVAWFFDFREASLTIEVSHGANYIQRVIYEDELPPSNYDLMLFIRETKDMLAAKERRLD